MYSGFFQSIILLAFLLGQMEYAYSGNDRDVETGAEIYNRCIGCHAPAYHRTGPRHCGLLGRRAGSVSGFEFTMAMQDADIIWNEDTLDQFLVAPLTMIPGTSMGFAGIASSRERAKLITFLKTLTADNPLCR